MVGRGAASYTSGRCVDGSKTFMGYDPSSCPRPYPRYRLCFTCGHPIAECMGFNLGRDLLAHANGKIPGALVRELCQHCADAARYLEVGYYPCCGPLG